MSAAGAAIAVAAAKGLLELGSASVKNKQSYKYSKKLMKYQNELNVENWNRVNEYNLPINERQRLLKAGINPNFGQGSSVAQSISGPTATMDAAGPDLGSMVDAGIQAYAMEKQTDNIEANTKKTQEETKGLAIDNANKMLYDYQDRGNKIAIDEATITKLQNEGIISAEQARVARSKATNEVALQNADIAAKNKQTSLMDAYYDLAQRGVEANEASVAEVIRENMFRDFLDSSLAEAKIENMKADTAVKYIESKMKQYALASGLYGAQLQADIDLAAATAYNYRDMAKKRGVSIGEFAGSLLKQLIEEPENSVLKNLLHGDDKGNRSTVERVLETILPNWVKQPLYKGSDFILSIPQRFKNDAKATKKILEGIGSKLNFSNYQ